MQFENPRVQNTPKQPTTFPNQKKHENHNSSHKGMHDDVFWASALAVYATCEMAPEPFLAVVPRIAYWRLSKFRRRLSGKVWVGFGNGR